MIDPDAIAREHVLLDGWCCTKCGLLWPCETYLLAKMAQQRPSAVVDAWKVFANLLDEDSMPKNVLAFATKEDRHEIAEWVLGMLKSEPY